ncbi:YihY/virulence factor BrkB family protein [Gordonia rubripertincta]|uniref:YihY/virulence factor BrkB family protein n=1 Tax=Gordonia rubripertincta TaxID=36822 RepID=UPI000B8D3671|nr:YihY/virulence factor BrkB family protein [Gordonia rubripertincta]ASR03617.1 Ribonuclease BN-like family protein [Gordonia rubripertincta]
MPLTDDATSPVAAVRPNPSSAVTAPLDTSTRTPRPSPLAGDTGVPGVTAPASRDVAVVPPPTRPTTEPAKPEGVDEPVPANGTKEASDSDGADDRPGPPVLPNMHRVVWRTIVKSWDDGIIGWAAQAAFWQALSLPPLLLGLLGSVGYVAGWFGPGTVDIVYDRIIEFAQRTFTETVVDDLITPTVDSVLGRGRIGLMSVGFILSLWAGSSAMSCFIASIAKAHDQHEVRHPVWQRFFALFLYVGFLFVAVFLLPLVALGPNYLRAIVPESWGSFVTTLIDYGYFPFVAVLLLFVLTTLYHLALPNPLPWHRLIGGAIVAGVFFWVASYVLRIYLTKITEAGVSYGALATPIAFLLFTFSLGFGIVIGAEFNAAVQQFWPAKASTTTQVRHWVNSQTSDITGQLKTIPDRLSSGPIRRPTRDHRGGD